MKSYILKREPGDPVPPKFSLDYDAELNPGQLAAACALEGPVLVIAGTRDGIVPLSHSRRLFDAASEPKRFVAIEGADHNDLALLAGDQLVRETAQWLRGAR